MIGASRFTVSKSTLLWAALILVVGIGVSGVIAYVRLHPGADPYEAQIGPIVQQYNGIVRRWNTFVDEFNAYPPPSVGDVDQRAVNGLALTGRLANDAQRVITDWNAVTPPPRFVESHRLAGEAMYTTQSAFLEMSLYLQDIVKLGVAFSDRAEAASLKLDEAAELLDRARAAARAAR